MEHGLLLDNLLDLAHAPFTHTSTFAKGWSVPRFVRRTIVLSINIIVEDGEKILVATAELFSFTFLRLPM